MIPHFDITVVITAHREGLLAGMSLTSCLDAIAMAERDGLSIEKLLILDCANDETKAVFEDAHSLGFAKIETDFGDQGQARNLAVQQAKGRYIAFLDADDLWGYNWLVEAYTLCVDRPRIIAHPEYNWFFEGSNNILVKADQESNEYTNEFLRFGNYWDALCLAPRQAYLDVPYYDRDVKGGFAYEDWFWNCVTIEKGYIHKSVPNTVHFKRRRQGSQTLEASKNKTLTRMTDIFDYSWSGYQSKNIEI